MSRIIGSHYEDLACKYLKQKGLKFKTKNFQRKCGEIDLIMQEDETIVFIEVRFRYSSKYGNSIETIDYRKQQKLTKTASLYLQKTNSYDKVACRFDVVVIDQNATQIEWIKNAF